MPLFFGVDYPNIAIATEGRLALYRWPYIEFRGPARTDLLGNRTKCCPERGRAEAPLYKPKSCNFPSRWQYDLAFRKRPYSN